MPKRRFTLIELLVAVAVVALAATLLAFAYKHSHRRHHGRTKCPNNLRQLGLAAMQYADDKRFYPHFGRLRSLDGDISANHATKGYRALLWFGYHDNPEGWICPNSDDRYTPLQPAVQQDLRRWFWGGGALTPQRSRAGATRPPTPWVDGELDPALIDTLEISYGWTRKLMNTSVLSTAPLGADRSRRVPGSLGVGRPPGKVGNHTDGWNLLKADSTIEFVGLTHDPDGKGPQDTLTWMRSTIAGGGYLAVAD